MTGKQTQAEALTTEPSVEQMFRDATIQRYAHGGGRVFWEGADGRRQLLVDLYGAEDGAIREYVLRTLAWAPDLLALAKQYSTECLDCNYGDGPTGKTPEGEPCEWCGNTRALIDKAEGRDHG